MSSYQELKKANPAFPILVRECSGVEAKLIARYGAPPPPPPPPRCAALRRRTKTSRPCAAAADFGTEHSVPIEGLGKAAISKQLEELVKLGEKMPRSTESEGEVAAA
jgi:NADH dehydrogenase (ubiquinone) 1 alpha subcomplex subunit 2